MSDDEIYQRYLMLNANPERMGGVLADIIRQILRASVSNGSSQEYKATNSLDHFLGLCFHSEGVRVFDVVRNAVDDLRVEAYERNSADADRVRFAKAALRFLIESSCNDAAASGRASQRWRDVENAWRMIEEMREYRREQFKSGAKSEDLF